MIIPAIIPESREHLLASLDALGEITHDIQIDLVDSVYGEKASWPWASDASYDAFFEVLRGISKTYAIEVDLMAEDGAVLAEGLIKAGATRLVFHPDSKGVWPDTTSYRGRAEIGLAVYNDAPLEPFFEVAGAIDYVQCMGIAKVGAQGLPFDDRVLDHIRDIHARFPKLQIGVDGGVSMFTVSLLKHAGAMRFVAGSAIFHTDNPKESFAKLEALARA